MRALLLALALLLAAPALAGPARLTDPQVRGFVARQSQAWNAGDLAGYFASFNEAARFTDQALGADNSIVPYGQSTLAQARAQSRRTLARGKLRETAAVTGVTLAADGLSARVAADVVSEITTSGGVRRVCAQRIEILALTPAGLRATGQTDTVVRCRARAIR